MCSGDSSVKNATIALIFILFSLALVIGLGHTSIFKMYDNKTLDSRFYWRHRLLDLPAPSTFASLASTTRVYSHWETDGPYPGSGMSSFSRPFRKDSPPW